MIKSLYICYFGVREPLVQTQVIPYLREIVNVETCKGEKVKKPGTEISLLTFEPEFKAKWNAAELADMRAKLAAEGIDWHHLPYHKRPSAVATAWDILRGAVRVWRLNRRERFDILHCRVHVPGVMADLARTFSRHKPKMLFDIRGFFPEEFVDAGLWPADGILFRAAKRIEKRLMKVSDGFVVLTEKARDILFPESRETGYDKHGRPVEVIPCCVDFEKRFGGSGSFDKAAAKKKLGLNGRFVVVHLGALGGVYLTQEIADILATARSMDERTFAMILTQSNGELIRPLLEGAGFTPSDYIIKRVAANEVGEYLAAGDVGVSMVVSSFASLSRSPTKIPEYLACGLPIIANRGVGDVDKLIEENGVGVMLEEFSPTTYKESLKKVKDSLGPTLHDHCYRLAMEKFHLNKTGRTRYQRIYFRLTEPGENIS